MLRKNKKLKGFTLVELIVVIAIMGVLAAILIPAMTGFVDKAKKKATVENAEALYTAANYVLLWDENAAASFYNTDNKANMVSIEATADGKCVRHVGGINSKPAEGNYMLTVVARCDGRNHPTQRATGYPEHVLKTWDLTVKNDAYAEFARALSKEMGTEGKEFPVPMPYGKRQDNGVSPCVRWVIGYRLDNKEQIEVWAADGSTWKDGLVYRVYPEPNSNYDY